MQTGSKAIATADVAEPAAGRLLRAMPLVFVFIWSTGFVVARYGMPYAPPMKFLAVRFGLSVACFAAWAWAARARWPAWAGRQWLHLAVTGVLMQGIYLGGVWTAVKLGMGAGLTSLLVSLQPILTAIWLSSRGNRVSLAQWVGLALGFAGLLMVVWAKLELSEVHPESFACTLISLLAITTGTLYQKHFVTSCDVRTASVVQLGVGFLLTLPLALLEGEPMHWVRLGGGFEWELIGAMLWSVIGLTLGGSSLLFLMIQRGAATAVTSLFYLVPPTTALLAWILFGESITALTIAGTALTALGVGVALHPKR